MCIVQGIVDEFVVVVVVVRAVAVVVQVLVGEIERVLGVELYEIR